MILLNDNISRLRAYRIIGTRIRFILILPGVEGDCFIEMTQYDLNLALLNTGKLFINDTMNETSNRDYPLITLLRLGI